MLSWNKGTIKGKFTTV